MKFYPENLMPVKYWRKWWKAFKKENSEFIAELQKMASELNPSYTVKQEASKPKIDEVQKKPSDWLAVGQIWGVLDDDSPLSKSGLIPVIITDCDPHQIFEVDGEEYRQIKVAPLDMDFEFLDADDVAVQDSALNPLGRPFVIQLWNEQTMLASDLCDFKGEIPSGAIFFSRLIQAREEPTPQQETLLRAIKDGGVFEDPLWQHRLRCYQKMEHLRGPVIEAQKEMFKKFAGSTAQ